MKKQKKQNAEYKIPNTNKGITLIALVITIIILLILAGVTISLVLAEGGLFKTGEEQKKAEIKDIVSVMLSEYMIEKYTKGTLLENYLEEQIPETLDAITNTGNGEFTVEKDGYLITIKEEDLSIIDISKTGKTVKIEFSATSVKPGENLTATVTFGNEINVAESKWVFTKEKTVQEASYSESFSTNPETITLDTTTEGSYYLHILLVDKDGNKIGKVSKEVIVTSLVTEIILNKTNTVISVGETETLTVTIKPEGLDDTELKWISNNETVATVDEKGTITGKTEGRAEIKVEAQDGSGKTATCIVLVGELVTEITTTEHETMKTIDHVGNIVTMPGGFKVAKDTGATVQEGIVVEDREGNQFVWIPVSNINHDGSNKIILDNGKEVEITLGRYTFATSSPGTATVGQYASNYTTTVTLKDYYQELRTFRESNQVSGSAGTNATSKDLAGFIDSVSTNKGYYLARYEASYASGSEFGVGDNDAYYKPASKKSTTYSTSAMSYTAGTLWNYITQGNASMASRQMYYGDEFVESDLCNSYAWDTAILYIQAMGNDNYANANRDTTGNKSLLNTGATGDVKCKIYDMAANLREWTTEYSIKPVNSDDGACVLRGGRYDTTSHYTSIRSSKLANAKDKYYSFRILFYAK